MSLVRSAVAVAVVVSFSARAQDGGTWVLHAARAIAPKSGVVTAPAWVTVTGERLVAVSSQPPDAGPVRELGDCTVLPGLIDAHSHLLHVEKPGDDHSLVVEAVTSSDAERALRGARFARQMLEAGFTTVRDLGNSGRYADVALKRAVKKGWVVGPAMLVSGRALAPAGGQFVAVAPGHEGVVDQEYAIVSSPDTARAAVREAFAAGADLVKVIVDHGPGRMLSAAELNAIVAVAHENGRKVAAHVLTAKAADLAVAAGVDSLEHAYDLPDATLKEMAKKKIYLVPTDYPESFYEAFAPAGSEHDTVVAMFKKFHARSMERLTRARKAGVPIAFGSDGYTITELDHRGREAALVFRAYAEAGMPPLEVIRAATSNAAALLGLPDGSATLDKGSVADLVVVRGDPTRDVGALEAVELTVSRGRVVPRAY